MATTTAGEELCDACGTLNPIFDSEHGYYRCRKCDHVWASDEDDPDYEEVEKDDGPYVGYSGDVYSRNDIYMQGEYDPIHDERY